MDEDMLIMIILQQLGCLRKKRLAALIVKYQSPINTLSQVYKGQLFVDLEISLKKAHNLH